MIERLLDDGDPPSVTVIVAHPDDEIVSFGGALRRLSARNAVLDLVHVTDGAPRDMRDASAAGFASRQAYARARRLELATALRIGDIRIRRVHVLGFVDQEASFGLPALAAEVETLLEYSRPQIVVTHPYEGGHPDHDATAFAVHTAVSRLHASDVRITIAELASYHNDSRGFRAGQFLPRRRETEQLFNLSDDERQIKQQMIDAFETQRATLAGFPVAPERVRRAPAYSFVEPPHAGTLLYELFDWGIRGAEWRRQAQRALETLSTPADGRPV